MDLRSLTYTSIARLDLGPDDLNAIHQTARRQNALDGITGLLVFNGTHFLQVIEGTQGALDDLMERLRRDRRHTGLEIRDARPIEARSFPDWSMELVRVEADFFQARDTIRDRVPASLAADVRGRLLHMTEAISGTVRM